MDDRQQSCDTAGGCDDRTDRLTLLEAKIADALAALDRIVVENLNEHDAGQLRRARHALAYRSSTIPEDVGQRAQRAAEARLSDCWEAFYAEEEGDMTVQSAACAPFCGCETCVVREVLDAAWSLFEEHAVL